MQLNTELPLSEQREILRNAIHNQRELIALAFIHATEANNSYPRSMTLRFLTQQPAAKILAELATLAIGAKFFRSITKALTFARMINSISIKRK